MKIFVITVLLLSAVAANGQIRSFKWTDELCEYRGTYNAKKYTPEQLQNTMKLFAVPGFDISTDATVFKYKDIAKLSLAKLEEEYKSKTSALTNLDIVQSPYFEGQRQSKLREMQQKYMLSRMTIRAWGDPAAAFAEKFPGAEQCYTKFAGPITRGGPDLLAAWRRVNEESQAKNGDPARVSREFEEQYASADKMKYALVEVMDFGWWNCANHTIDYITYDGTQEKQFKKLFIRVKTISCDEP